MKLTKNFFITVLFVGMIFAGCMTIKAESTKKEKLNFLVILADDLGWKDLGCYGSSFYETPNLDRLAAEGIRFTNGYANCPVCSPTRASFQTGKYPNKTGISDFIRLRERLPKENDRWINAPNADHLPLSETTVGEAMKANGYQTFFAGKWHLGNAPEYWPEHQGYEINKGGWKRGAPNRDKKLGYDGYFSPYGNPRLEDGPEGEYLPERLTSETIDFIKANKKRPFFACLCYYLVHIPLQGKADLINKYKEKREELGLDQKQEFTEHPTWAKYASNGGKFRDREIQGNPVYASMVQSLDDNIGRLLDMLQETGLDKNTVIIFTSDNGGLSSAEGSPTSNLPLRGGKGWLTEGGIREPWIFKYPGLEKPGTVNATPVITMDIFPTVLGFAGIDPSPYKDIDGINMVSCLEGEKPHERPLFWHYPYYSNQGGDPGSAVVYGDYKLIYDIETGSYQLYNLKTDIGENRDISNEKPEMTSKLKKMLNDWKTEIHAKKMQPNPGWNEIDKARISQGN